MMQAAVSYSAEEYFALEERSAQRHEFWDGYVRAMAGAEPEHNLLTSNIAREVGNRLIPRGCWVMSSDQRVQVGTRYVYPDVVVACSPEYADTRPRSLLNPELLVEVTSPTTAALDCGEKLAAYTAIASLREYWIADPEQVLLTQYIRSGVGWIVQIYNRLDMVLQSTQFDLAIPMAALYTLVLDNLEARDGNGGRS